MISNFPDHERTHESSKRMHYETNDDMNRMAGDQRYRFPSGSDVSASTFLLEFTEILRLP